MRTVSIVGTGCYLPERVLTNAEIEKMVDTSDEWIVTRTGIRERHIARADEYTSDLGAAAARRALEAAGTKPEEVDLLINATISPDMIFPSTACFIQDKIGAKRAFCFDVQAACAGFVYAAETARLYLASGQFNTALVVGSEKLSSFVDWQDRTTCVLFGDGAGAAVLKAGTPGRGILATVMGSDGSLAGLLNVPGGGTRHPASPATLEQRLHYMKMSGNEVFKHAVRCMCDAAQKTLDKAGLSVQDVKWVVPHQANMRIIQAIASRFGDSMERFIVNLDRVGNLSGASIPTALDEAVRKGQIRKGDIVQFVAFGGGFTWGSMVMEWGYDGAVT